MSITDELREWIYSITWLDESVSQAHKNVLAIADRIDERHRRALEKVSAMVDEPDYFDAIIDANSTPKRIDALEQRVSVLERKLNHKG